MRTTLLSGIITLVVSKVVFAVEQATTDGPSNPAGVTGNVHWANLLNVSMWFYEAQRSGKLPPDNRVSW